MRVSPTLFSGPMVRAILREIEAPGTGKTQTRRLLKSEVPSQPEANCHPNHSQKHPAPYLNAYCSEQGTVSNPRGMSRHWCWWQVDDRQCLPTFDVKYAPGDVLYVRETWGECESFGGYLYRATHDGDDPVGNGWRPSIHMPRRASRLTLVVTDVRVERLQDISEADANAEGCGLYVPGHGFIKHDELSADPGYSNFLAPKMGFEAIWTEINGAKSWAENPWVVAVTFTPHLINVDAFLANREAA